MATAQFHHFGVPTNEQQPNETYLEGAKVFITDPEAHPYRVEFLRFEEGTPMPPELCNGPHAAFLVENLDEALVGQKVLIEPFDATDELRCAFIMFGPALIEVMEKRK